METTRKVFMHSKPKANPKKSRTTIAGIIDMEAREIRIHGARNNTSKNEPFTRPQGRSIALGRATKNPLLVIKLNNTKDRKKIQQKFINIANQLIKKPYRLQQEPDYVAKKIAK